MADVSVKNLKIYAMSGLSSSITYFAKWEPKSQDYYNKTDNYSFEWRYYTAKTWFSGQSGTAEKSTPSCTYSPPENATFVQVRVKPVAKKHTVDNKEQAYFEGKFTSWVKKRVPDSVDSLLNYLGSSEILDLKVGVQAGTSNKTAYARWGFSYEKTNTLTKSQMIAMCEKAVLEAIARTNELSENIYIPSAILNEYYGTKTVSKSLDQVESFSCEWKYYTKNKQWFPGETSSVDPQSAKEGQVCLYSIPDNATVIKVRVKAISKTRYGDKYFKESWSKWVSFKVPKTASATPVDPYDYYPDYPALGIDTLSVELVKNANNIYDGKVSAKWTHSISTIKKAQIGKNAYINDTTQVGTSQVDTYTIEWRYLKNGNVLEGSSTTNNYEDLRYAEYDVPEGATQVRCRVRPNSKSYTFKTSYKDTTGETEEIEDEIEFFNGVFSEWQKINIPTIPATPSAPSVSVKDYRLTVEASTTDANTERIEFQVVRDNTSIFATGTANVTTGYAAYQFPIDAGSKYKARCRGLNDLENGEWSDYSSEIGGGPAAVTGTIICRAESSTMVFMSWNAVNTATSYSIERTTQKRYFDASPDKVQSSTTDTNRAYIPDLDSGEEYFFRIKAIDDDGNESSWSAIVSTVLAKTPDPPTTWSSTTTAIVGRDVFMYWTHNSTDNSRERVAELELVIDGVKSTVTINNDTYNSEDDTDTKSYVFVTSGYQEGSNVKWRVRTKGIGDNFSEWSVQRILDIYAPPVLNIEIGRSVNWHWDPFNFRTGNIYTSYGDLIPLVDDELTSFPMFVRLASGPRTQTPVGYQVTIIADESYEDVDSIGNRINVVSGQELFDKYYDSNDWGLMDLINASDVNLENGMSYTIKAIVSMDSGLTAETSKSFTVNWDNDEDFNLDAEIGYDPDTVTTYLRPYCNDEEGNAIPYVELSVWRREFDGDFVLVAGRISNISRPTVTDPHPEMDYARYRIIGQNVLTGKVSYYDLPAYPVKEPGIIIQWDEQWTSFDTDNEDALAERPYTGSMLRLDYNVDTSDQNDVDVEFAEYAGRRHPVSYYGTQVGQTSTWKTDVKADDTETLYALRRLSVWLGNAYVREQYGTGYWAQVKVSYNIDHQAVIIPVTFSITRVEGGL